MSHIVEKKAENYKNCFIIKFHQNFRQISSLEILRFFFFLSSIWRHDTKSVGVEETSHLGLVDLRSVLWIIGDPIGSACIDDYLFSLGFNLDL